MHGAAEVAQHDLAVADDARCRRLMVRARRVLAGRDDREVRTLVAGRKHALHELTVHVELGPATEGDVAHRGRDRVDGCAAAFASAAISSPSFTMRNGPDDVDRAFERRGRQRALEVEHETRPRVVADRDSARTRARQPGDERDRIVGLFPRHDLEQIVLRDDAGRFQAGHDETCGTGARQHEHRQAFERHRFVAGEVRQVGSDRQQQRVDTERVHAGVHDVDARLMAHTSIPGRPSTLVAFFDSQ